MKVMGPVSAVLFGISTLGSLVSAQAQTSREAAGQTPAADAAPEVVITGSRLITSGQDSPTPLTALQASELQATTPANIPDALNKLPQFIGSNNVQTNGNASGNFVGNYLNLRGFGAERTLVLLDGRRVPATGPTNAVDINVLPQMLLERVDVVTGGASAVYGSDAIAGVVNFVLDKKFNGVKAQIQDGISNHGDARSWRAGIAGGTDLFGGGTHVESSFEHYSSDPLSVYARPAGRAGYTEQGAGTAASPLHLVSNSRWTIATDGGLIFTGPLAGQEFAANGVLTPFVHGLSTPNPAIEQGGDGATLGDVSALASLQTDQAFGRVDHDFDNGITGFAQVLASQAYNTNSVVPFYCLFCTIPSTNAFLPAAAQTTLANAGVSNFLLGLSAIDTPHMQAQSRARDLDATLGLNGKLFSNFTWDVYYTHGLSGQTVTNSGNVNSQRLAAALDSIVANGQIVCRVTVTNPTLYPGCVPLNLFGPTASSAAAMAYVRGNTQFTTTNREDDVGASIHGDLFDDWAGPVRAAVSAEYQRLSFTTVSDAQPYPIAHADCTGIAYGCTPTTPLWVSNVVGNAAASEHISEAALEVEAPLLKDVLLVKSLSIDGAVRRASYSLSSSATTWKIGVNWAVTSDVRVRATRSQDIRAPNLNDLFAAADASATGYTDIHTGVGGILNVVQQGNPRLVPEVAKTSTAGLVYSPQWLAGFNLSVDYFNITMDNAIATVDPRDTAVQTQCEASNGTSPLCGLFVRPFPFSDRTAANYPSAVLDEQLNVAKTWTHGVDGELNYSADLEKWGLPRAGQLSLRLLVTYQPILASQTIPGAVTVDSAGAATQPASYASGAAAAQPVTKASFLAHYTNRNLTIDVQERWRSQLKQSGDPTLVFSDPPIPALALTDLTIGYAFHPGAGDIGAFLSVENLFDKAPPIFANTTVASTPGFAFPVALGDDVRGRYFTLGLRARF